jgi:sugar phosphate isomerase/epimerase
MKLSFSTLGCPTWDLDTVIKKAKAYGFEGVEIRGIKDQLDVTQLPEFTTQSKQTKQKFSDAGIEIVCFSSSVRMSEPDKVKRGEYLEELKRYAEVCEIFDTPCIRIFGGEIGELSWEQALDEAAETLEKMIKIIRDVDAKIVIETHDDWMSCDHFKALMEKVNSNKVGILWDVNHPFMFIGEDPVKTWEKIGEWIYHTHWKDSKIAIDTVMGFEPCLMGEGDLPHEQIYDVLKNGGYNGYLSLEWEKRWHPELPDPEIAFPQYFRYMKNLMNLNQNKPEPKKDLNR